MKIAFVTCAMQYTSPEPIMSLLDRLGIDFYTRWDRVQGKGHGTPPHLHTASFPSENSVLMIAFEDEALLAGLIQGILQLNERAMRADERIRLFQLPLDRII